MSNKLRLIGYWTDGRDERFCLPQEVVGYLAPDIRLRLGEYLEAGEHCGQELGHSWCRFDCGVPYEEMGSAHRTDGSWVWPAGLSHYVRQHGIVLPEEFIAHALAQTPGPPSEVTQCLTLEQAIRMLTSPMPACTLDFWQDWCAAHRVPAVVEALRELRAEQSRRAREAMDKAVADLVAREGLSQESCIYAGCPETALRGRKVCARHMLRQG